jgi:hypothetical protein
MHRDLWRPRRCGEREYSDIRAKIQDCAQARKVDTWHVVDLVKIIFVQNENPIGEDADTLAVS